MLYVSWLKWSADSWIPCCRNCTNCVLEADLRLCVPHAPPQCPPMPAQKKPMSPLSASPFTGQSSPLSSSLRVMAMPRLALAPRLVQKENAGPWLSQPPASTVTGFLPFPYIFFLILNLLTVHLQICFIFENLPLDFCVNLEMGSPLKRYVPHRSRRQMHTPADQLSRDTNHFRNRTVTAVSLIELHMYFSSISTCTLTCTVPALPLNKNVCFSHSHLSRFPTNAHRFDLKRLVQPRHV